MIQVKKGGKDTLCREKNRIELMNQHGVLESYKLLSYHHQSMKHEGGSGMRQEKRSQVMLGLIYQAPS